MMSRAQAVCGPLCQHPSCWEAQKIKSQTGPRFAPSFKKRKPNTKTLSPVYSTTGNYDVLRLCLLLTIFHRLPQTVMLVKFRTSTVEDVQ